jgi:D-alanine--poly(phosphoribitol) ligase subunit 1
LEKDFGLKTAEVYMNPASFSFDVSMYELYGFLINGGTLVLNTEVEYKNPNLFLERIKKYACTVWVSTPTFAYLYLSDPRFNGKHLPALKTFLFCGESLPKKTAKMLLERFPGSRVLNTYGPTEATVATTLIEVTSEVLEKYKDMPVGYAKYTSEVVIDNETQDQTEPGEIIITGDNVSIGYFNNPELNKEKYFIRNGKRSFRTGDYGYYKDNILFFSGRKDEQVKLHGYRIELGDINTQIAKHPKVKEAVTVPLKVGDTVKKLISFVQLKEQEANVTPLKTDIIETIKKVLPEYMIPGDIMMVSEFPVNNNLKIDKSKLIELYMASA